MESIKAWFYSRLNGYKRAYKGWKAASVAFQPRTSINCFSYGNIYLEKQKRSWNHKDILLRVTKLARLTPKFGGEGRKIALLLEELENIITVRSGNAGDIKKLQIFWT